MFFLLLHKKKYSKIRSKILKNLTRSEDNFVYIIKIYIHIYIYIYKTT